MRALISLIAWPVAVNDAPRYLNEETFYTVSKHEFVKLVGPWNVNVEALTKSIPAVGGKCTRIFSIQLSKLLTKTTQVTMSRRLEETGLPFQDGSVSN